MNLVYFILFPFPRLHDDDDGIDACNLFMWNPNKKSVQAEHEMRGNCVRSICY